MITYIGWVGHHNLGDEALYSVNQKIFDSYHLIPSCARRRRKDWKQYSKITMFGGGTVFPRWPSFILPNEFNYAYGIGVRNPSFWGDFPSFLIKQIKKFNFRYLGVRGNISKKILKKWGLNSEVIGDPCLLLKTSQLMKKEDTRIAINVGSDSQIWGRNRERVLIEITKLCKNLKKGGYNLILIPFNTQSLKYIEKIANITKTNVFRDWQNIQAVVDIIGSSCVLIGEKLHSLVFSAATSTPFISIEYRPKCYDFVESVGFEQYNIKTSEMTYERIMRMLNEIIINRRELHKLLEENVDVLQKKLINASQHIRRDIESLPEKKWSIPKLQLLKFYSLSGQTHLYKIRARVLRTIDALKPLERAGAGKEPPLNG